MRAIRGSGGPEGRGECAYVLEFDVDGCVVFDV